MSWRFQRTDGSGCADVLVHWWRMPNHKWQVFIEVPSIGTWGEKLTAILLNAVVDDFGDLVVVP